MTNKIYKYCFPESAPPQELEDTLMLAMQAVESLHGRSRAWEECRFSLDKTGRTCMIDASTEAGNDLDCIFTVLAFKKYGVNAVNVEQIIWQKIRHK